ncbi:hypothetical protein NG798_04745 [Ancylothrix sp. C2]|uniref:hypothetical protein n=1 Tax=Ancylothrix sp. D3o TaxID=2953691 RepID=UPI0021BB8E3D|nr:hypothetical protein [Ancylothrix sp. D3o]MCT7949086.1 hypothetical protein [Ancylothrix sp. D3o]
MADSEWDCFDVPEWAETEEMAKMIAALRQSGKMNSEMMRLSTWVLSETMDEFLPGFWSRFMANRQVAHKQFMQRKQV